MNKDKITINGMEPSNYNSAYFTMLKEAELEIAHINLKATEYACMEDFINHKKALATGVWVLEDVQMSNNHRDAVANAKAATGGTMGKISNAVSKAARTLVETIQKVVKFFIDNATKFFTENSQWIADNRGKINSITNDFWKDCTVTAYPYFMHTDTPFTGDDGTGFKPIGDRAVQDFINSGTGADDIRNIVCSKVNALNQDSFAAAAKQYYRNDAQQHDFTDQDAKKFCINAMNYAMNYSRQVAPQLKGNIERAVSEMGKDGIKESFVSVNDDRLYSILENQSILESEELKDINLVDSNGGFVVITENDEQHVEGGANKNGGTPTEPAQSDTNGSNPSGDTGSQVQSRKLKYWNLYWNLQTAKLTIAEECRNSCMRTLRAVLRNAESRNQVANPQGGTTQPSSPVGSTGEGNRDNYVQGVNVGKTALPSQ